MKYFNELSKMTVKINPNLRTTELNDIKYFIKNHPFSVIQCDKNVGLAIISNKLKNKLSFEHLEDKSIYQVLNTNPLKGTISIINNTLNSLMKNKQIKLSLYNQLIAKNSKLGKFRILCKLHKSKFGIRPIINNKNHPTSQICKFIDLILQPLVKQTSTYVKDSQYILQKYENKTFDCNEIILYTADIEALYTNIDKNQAADLITEEIKNNLDTNFVTAMAFNTIIRLIFENNIFKYENKYYIQINGIAMGCICGPSIANIFVHILERKWLVIHQPIIYDRFIDDIFVGVNKKIDYKEFQSHFLNLKFTFNNSKKVNFLDLIIKFDPIIKKLQFSMHIKPTNTFSYLLTTSNHPNHIFNNIPKSLFIRIRRICDSIIDYNYYSRELIFRLNERGYDYKKICSLAHTIGEIDRTALLPYKLKKKTFYEKNSFIFGIKFNKSTIKEKNLIIDTFDEIKSNYKWLSDYKLNIYNFMSNSLNSIFVHNNKIDRNYQTYKCNTINCKTCNFINYNSYIMLKNGFILPIMSNSNCLSTKVVYIIRCILCDCFYIGQTGRSANKRWTEHFKAIEKFVPFYKYTNEVGYHFNLKNHFYKKHLKLYIFKNNLENDLISGQIRKSIETDLINLIKNFNGSIMNDKIPKYYNNLCFSYLKT
jgi:hypothetical protein